MEKLITGNLHLLKTWPPFYSDVQSGLKTFEIRRDDRDFHIGDILVLQEWNPVDKQYTGEMTSRLVLYKVDGGQFGIEKGFCVLGLGPLPCYNNEEIINSAQQAAAQNGDEN